MEHLAFERTGPVGILRVDRPEALNALNRSVLKEMREFLSDSHGQRMRALILTGSGEKAFIAGADIKEMQNISPVEMMRFSALGQEVSRLIEEAPFVCIAAVNGFCLGGGLELALACDFIYAADNAKLGLPEVKLGLIPGFGGTQRLPRAIGSRMAKELIYSGRHIDAQEALRIGLVNRVYPAADLVDACEATAKEICGNSQFAIIQAKTSVNLGAPMGMREALELERNMCAVSFGTPDRLEGMTAFVEKREPVFS